jgi:hypothetical protein
MQNLIVNTETTDAWTTAHRNCGHFAGQCLHGDPNLVPPTEPTIHINGRAYTRFYFANISGGQTSCWRRDDGQQVTSQKLAALKRKFGAEGK